MSKPNLRVKRAPSAGLHRDPAFAAFDEDTVLCELNAGFKRSKRELIHRFLSDQEELNRRFAEYELNSDEECSQVKSSGHTEAEQEGVDPFADLQLPVCRSSDDDCESNVADNLSTLSAVHTSSIESIPDLADLEEDEKQRTQSMVRQRPRVGTACITNDFDGSPEEGVQPWPKQSLAQRQESRRSKKVLVKKNIRPKTAMGIRFPFSMDDDSDEQDTSPRADKDDVEERVPADPSLYHSLNLPHNRSRRKFSWLNETVGQDSAFSSYVPSGSATARLGSARSLKSATYWDSHVSANNRHSVSNTGPFCPSSSGSLPPGVSRVVRTPTYEISLTSELERPSSRALSHRSSRPDSTCSITTAASHAAAATRLTMNVIGPSGVRTRSKQRGALRISHNDTTALTGVVSGGGGYTPSAGPSLRKNKRHIALLKLPPLDTATVMASKGSLVDAQPVVGPVTKGTTVPAATESLAG